MLQGFFNNNGNMHIQKRNDKLNGKIRIHISFKNYYKNSLIKSLQITLWSLFV